MPLTVLATIGPHRWQPTPTTTPATAANVTPRQSARASLTAAVNTIRAALSRPAAAAAARPLAAATPARTRRNRAASRSRQVGPVGVGGSGVAGGVSRWAPAIL